MQLIQQSENVPAEAHQSVHLTWGSKIPCILTEHTVRVTLFMKYFAIFWLFVRRLMPACIFQTGNCMPVTPGSETGR